VLSFDGETQKGVDAEAERGGEISEGNQIFEDLERKDKRACLFELHFKG